MYKNIITSNDKRLVRCEGISIFAHHTLSFVDVDCYNPSHKSTPYKYERKQFYLISEVDEWSVNENCKHFTFEDNKKY